MKKICYIYSINTGRVSVSCSVVVLLRGYDGVWLKNSLQTNLKVRGTRTGF